MRFQHQQTIGELLDEGFALLRMAPREILLSVALLLSLPAAVSSIAVRPFLPADPAQPDPSFIVVIGLNSLVSLVTWTLSAAAVGSVVHQLKADRFLQPWIGVRRSFERLPQLLWTLVLLALASILAYAALVVAFVVGLIAARFLGIESPIAAIVTLLALSILPVSLAASFVLFPQVVALENCSGGRAIRRVWQLTSGARIRLALLAMLLVVLSVLMLLMFHGVRVFSEAFAFLVAIPAGLFVSAYILVVQSLEYMQLRIEKESYDLELLAFAIESGRRPTSR